MMTVLGCEHPVVKEQLFLVVNIRLLNGDCFDCERPVVNRRLFWVVNIRLLNEGCFGS